MYLGMNMKRERTAQFQYDWVRLHHNSIECIHSPKVRKSQFSSNGARMQIESNCHLFWIIYWHTKYHHLWTRLFCFFLNLYTNLCVVNICRQLTLFDSVKRQWKLWTENGWWSCRKRQQQRFNVIANAIACYLNHSSITGWNNKTNTSMLMLNNVWPTIDHQFGNIDLLAMLMIVAGNET